MTLDMTPGEWLADRHEMAEAIARNLRDEANKLEADSRAKRVEMEQWFAKAKEFQDAAIFLTHMHTASSLNILSAKLASA